MCGIDFSFLSVSVRFLSRVSILTSDIVIANLPVHLSVRYVPVLYENGLTYCHSFFHRSSPIILVLPALNIFMKYEIPTGSPPCGGTKYRWGIKISRFWTDNSLYLANDTK